MGLGRASRSHSVTRRDSFPDVTDDGAAPLSDPSRPSQLVSALTLSVSDGDDMTYDLEPLGSYEIIASSSEYCTVHCGGGTCASASCSDKSSINLASDGENQAHPIIADNAAYAWDLRQRFVGEVDVPEGEHNAQCITYAWLDRLA